MGKISTENEEPKSKAEPTERTTLEVSRPVPESLQEKPLEKVSFKINDK